MKNLVFILLCVGISINGRGQNLVPNYSFENYSFCPTAGSQIDYAVPWYGVTTIASSTDYYNTCGLVSSYQTPRTGNGYAGIWVYSGISDYREYLQVQIFDSLSIGSCYLIEYYINLGNPMKYGVSVDAYFSNSAITTTGTGYVLNLVPQIKKFNSIPVIDTTSWMKISCLYVATGGENFLTIGNFYDDLNTDTVNTGSSYYGSYYYIDDVSITPIDSIIGGMPAYSGNDTSLVLGDSVFIGQEITGLNCNWYNSSGTLIASNISGIYVQPTVDTWYVVQQNLCGNITYDTVNVNVTEVGIDENSLTEKTKVYPNPNTGEFTIELSLDNMTCDIKIIDTQGRLIMEAKTESKLTHLKTTAENGVYMLFISNPKTNESIVKRIIIQK